MTTYKDMEGKSEKDLAAIVSEGRETLRKERFGTAGAGNKDVKKIRSAKKDIARALTALNAQKRSDTNKNA